MMMFQLKQVFLLIFIILMIKSILAEHHLPEILTKTSNQTSNLSSTAILTCHIRCLGDHHVIWFKYDRSAGTTNPLAIGVELFTTDQRYSISSYSTSPDDSYWSLEIYQLKLSDEGTYICQISNRRATVSVSLHLHIQIPMLLSPEHLYVEPGSDVKLNCSISISHEHNKTLLSMIHWYFFSTQSNHTNPDDIHIQEKSFNHSLISYLFIHHAQTYHSGVWTCAYKRQRRMAKLTVEKDVLHRQRISALLLNNSKRPYASVHTFLVFCFVSITLCMNSKVG